MGSHYGEPNTQKMQTGHSIFKAIVDKVIVRTPVSFSFVLVNGMEFAIDGKVYSDGRKFKTREY